VHFHVVVRLDGAEDRATAPGVAVSPEELCDAIREAAARACLDEDAGDGETVEQRFGDQLHTRVLAGADDGGELCADQVAAYVAAAALRLSQRSGLRRIARWVHMLGFRGHFVTKSRGYSTTLGELRAARCAYRSQQDEHGEAEDDSTVVLSVWQYLGSGYVNPGDVLLAAGVEASLRVAREALLDLRRGPP
jgi:hypothetical protein